MRKLLTKFFNQKKCWYANKMLFSLILAFAFTFSILAQEGITGSVNDNNGNPVVGATILIKGTNIGTVSDANGSFTIAANEGNILEISFVGFESQEVTIEGGISTINITLNPSLEELDEVVVIGYGTQRKADITSAIASVKEEEFVKGAVKDVGQLLQGKVAGLTIVNSSGDPNGDVEVLLRGYSTINGDAAPYVIIDGIPGGDLKTVAPQDIESIDVLKDGSGAAIYGTRATNGVIIITTKKGKKNQPMSVEYDAYISTQTIYNTMDFMDASDYRRLIPDTLKGGLNIVKKFYDYGSETDWLGEITQIPVSHMHNLRLTGGTENSSYVASVNYNKKEGIFIKSKTEDIKAKLEINQSVLNDKLSFTAGVISGITTSPAVDPSYAYFQAVTRNPTDIVKDEDGNWVERDGYFYYNPVAILKEEDALDEARYNWLNGSVSFKPVKGLDIKLTGSKQVWNSNWARALSFKHYESTQNSLDGYINTTSTYTKANIIEFTTEYTKRYGLHNFTILGGYSYDDNFYKKIGIKNSGFPTDEFSIYNIRIGSALFDGRTDYLENTTNMNRLISFFGRINYNYASRYLFLASIRREGSTKFGKNNKWGDFPAIQLGWRLSEEAFLKDIDFVSDLKIRFGYGVTGVEPRDPYLSSTALGYSDTEYFYFNGEWIPTISANLSANPDLRWEEKREYNIALDFGFVDSRINGKLDLYKREIIDLIDKYSVPSPPNPASNKWANVGSLENKGIELLINTVPVKKSNLMYSSTITFAYNRNKLVKISSDEYERSTDYLAGGYTGEPIQAETHRNFVGESLGTFWGYKVVGTYPERYTIPGSTEADSIARWLIEVPLKIDPETGDTIQALDTIKFRSKNADSHRQVLGNGIPKYNISWSHTIKYKNWDLNIAMRGAFGFEILNFSRMFYENTNARNNPMKKAFEKVETPYITDGGEEKIGYFLLREDQAVTNWYIEKGDYWKIDNVTLGYTLNSKKSKYLKSFRVYASVLNLYTITNYSGIDPEVSQNLLWAGDDDKQKYPTTRTYTFGLQVKF